MLLFTGFALARDVVLVGERYAGAEEHSWPGALQACLDTVRPGSFAVVDATAPHPSVGSIERALDSAGSGTVVVVSMTQRADVGFLSSWRRALQRLLRRAGAEDRSVLLFGPWPAARVLVRETGSMPASAIGIVVDDRQWAVAKEVSAQRGVPQVPYEGPTARAQAALLPPAPKAHPSIVESQQRIWDDRPHLDPESLGRLACGAVLKASQE